MLSVRQISKTYIGPRSREVLHRVSLDLAAGEYVAIMGESGVGKSTLLNLIAGLDTPDTGTIHIGGVATHGLDDAALTRLRREKLGFVFQAFHVLPYLDVAGNVGLPLRLLEVPAAESAARVQSMLQAVGSSPAFSEVLSECRLSRTTSASVRASRRFPKSSTFRI